MPSGNRPLSMKSFDSGSYLNLLRQPFGRFDDCPAGAFAGIQLVRDCGQISHREFSSDGTCRSFAARQLCCTLASKVLARDQRFMSRARSLHGWQFSTSSLVAPALRA